MLIQWPLQSVCLAEMLGFDMKWIGVTLACLSLTVGTVQAAEVSPEGSWARGDGKARVTIGPCGNDLCAVNTWIRPGITDEKVGDRLIMTVISDGKGKWSGKAFDPQRNLTYRLTMEVQATTMTTTGCVLGGLICRRVDWTRLE